MNLARILGAVALALWLLAALAAVAALFDPAAVNAVLGIGFWAVLVSAAALAARRPRRDPVDE